MKQISEIVLNDLFEEHDIVDLAKYVKYYYLEQHRYYHNWNHILSGFYLFKKYYGNNIPRHIIIAWLFHDIVYIAGSKESEISSNNLLITLFKNTHSFLLNKYANDINKAQNYITATITHENKTNDKDLDIFLDVDMSYLGAEFSVFKKIRNQIRKEFIFYSDEEFKNGSILFFNKLIESEKIFLSDYFHNIYEKQCRENIKNHLIELK